MAKKRLMLIPENDFQNHYSSEKMSRLMKEQAAFIAGKTNLSPGINLLDVYCGNGAFVNEFISHVSSITAIGFSEKAIIEAGRTFPGINFLYADSPDLLSWKQTGQYQSHFDVITLCFSFRYFETVEKGMKLIEVLKYLLKPGGRIMLVSIPDRAKFFQYYHSIGRIVTLIRDMAGGKNRTGKFWSDEELDFICRQLGLKGEKVTKPTHFPHAYYCMDYLITKP